MSPEDNGIEIKNKRWFTVERVLLFVIVVLQAAILFRLWKDQPSIQCAARTYDSQLSAPAVRSQNIHEPSIRPRVPARIAQMQEAKMMFDAMDHMFASAINDFGQMGPVIDLDDGWDALIASPAMDMKERDNSYVVVFSLPGARPSDLTVTLEGPILTVTTSVHGEAGLKDQIGRFERAIQLPGPVGDASQAQATLTNGILRVSVPKADGSKTSSSKESKRLL